ncbi:putative sec1-like protein [Plasmopara halstedii]
MATVTSVADLHDVDLRKVVQDKVLNQMIKHVTQLTRGWVVMVVDDEATRCLTPVARMSDLTDCGVSLLERLELQRQPFPEMNVVYLIAPTVQNVRCMAKDFEDPNKPTYNEVYLYFLHHADEDILNELKKSPPALLQRLKTLQEVNIDFLALEKCAFSFGIPEAFHTLYSPTVKESECEELMQLISNKLVSVCATLEEYPYVRYQAGHTRMEMLAQMFQNKMNDYLAQNSTFSYAPKRGTLLFFDRGQDMVTPLMHESTFQAMTYDLLDVKGDQISYEAETNSGTTAKTAFLNENDKQWVEFRHTHIARVSTEIGKRMTALSVSNAGTSLGRGKSTDLHAMAAGLRELPEYREMLGKLSQHLFLAGKAMDIFTATALLGASNIEQTLATGVDESGKKLKHATIAKQLEDLFKDPKLIETDRFRVAAVFALTQDTMKEAERSKIMLAARLSKNQETILENMSLVAGSSLYKIHGNSHISSEELKLASKKAEAVEYSNARYDPKIKAIVIRALKRTLSETEYPYLITPPPQSPTADDSKKSGPVSLRKKNFGKLKPQEITPDNELFVGEKMVVFICGGGTYSELRSIYEARSEEKRDVFLGTTSFLAPPVFIELIATLKETSPTSSKHSVSSGQGAEVAPLTSGEIHLQLQTQQREKTNAF